jgi:hypothetical protein
MLDADNKLAEFDASVDAPGGLKDTHQLENAGGVAALAVKEHEVLTAKIAGQYDDEFIQQRIHEAAQQRRGALAKHMGEYELTQFRTQLTKKTEANNKWSALDARNATDTRAPDVAPEALASYRKIQTNIVDLYREGTKGGVGPAVAQERALEASTEAVIATYTVLAHDPRANKPALKKQMEQLASVSIVNEGDPRYGQVMNLLGAKAVEDEALMNAIIKAPLMTKGVIDEGVAVKLYNDDVDKQQAERAKKPGGLTTDDINYIAHTRDLGAHHIKLRMQPLKEISDAMVGQAGSIMVRLESAGAVPPTIEDFQKAVSAQRGSANSEGKARIDNLWYAAKKSAGSGGMGELAKDLGQEIMNAYVSGRIVGGADNDTVIAATAAKLREQDPSGKRAQIFLDGIQAVKDTGHYTHVAKVIDQDMPKYRESRDSGKLGEAVVVAKGWADAAKVKNPDDRVMLNGAIVSQIHKEMVHGPVTRERMDQIGMDVIKNQKAVLDGRWMSIFSGRDEAMGRAAAAAAPKAKPLGVLHYEKPDGSIGTREIYPGSPYPGVVDLATFQNLIRANPPKKKIAGGETVQKFTITP